VTPAATIAIAVVVCTIAVSVFLLARVLIRSHTQTLELVAKMQHDHDQSMQTGVKMVGEVASETAGAIRDAIYGGGARETGVVEPQPDAWWQQEEETTPRDWTEDAVPDRSRIGEPWQPGEYTSHPPPDLSGEQL
jgi:hypothetical protein